MGRIRTWGVQCVNMHRVYSSPEHFEEVFFFVSPQTTFSIQFFVGAVLVIIAFVCVALLEHYGSWDPAWRLSKVVYAILTGN